MAQRIVAINIRYEKHYVCPPFIFFWLTEKPFNRECTFTLERVIRLILFAVRAGLKMEIEKGHIIIFNKRCIRV